MRGQERREGGRGGGREGESDKGLEGTFLEIGYLIIC